ncbi:MULTISPECIES: hypothetical protein [unclassified Sporosarcina]|uniref:hypothetical protein n=1 Tax=unclassified Sporosarcina TaxID=2647733 RepID=UPI00203D6A9D|nr:MULTISPECIES: hypothetical protein [unclassified Sporosarcina]GKV65125.1 hypothetical protein NCCP2331_12780 [Sporosarcina sp. NCCP-2331]GLB55249.1 hypothetical protein NCCP2378_10350 [Sporosarcina sp. NCCP-2378]
MDEFDRRLSNEMKKRTEGISLSDKEKQQIHRQINRTSFKNKKRGVIIWTVAAAAVALFIVLVLPMLQEQMPNEQSAAYHVEDLEGISLSIEEAAVHDNGEIAYFVEINNDTSGTIREGTLSISYDLLLPNGFEENPFKQSEMVPGDIYPRSKTRLKFAVDPTVFKEERIDLSGISMELVGYWNKLEPQARFQVGQSTSVVSSDGSSN